MNRPFDLGPRRRTHSRTPVNCQVATVDVAAIAQSVHGGQIRRDAKGGRIAVGAPTELGKHRVGYPPQYRYTSELSAETILALYPTVVAQ